MAKLSETPLPWMGGLTAGFSAITYGLGRLLNGTEIMVIDFSIAAGLAGLLLGFIIWAETGKHRPPVARKK